jgi:hypothetical protein
MRRRLFPLLLFGAGAFMGACAPTIRIKLDPISIHAQLEADVRVHLDEDVKRLIERNPELF